uniref:SUZ domain-containing protein n=1 Tax=Kalanchoe fedtschenkoi TaxID=63787 RepID=A0A7N0TZ85_KALFE
MFYVKIMSSCFLPNSSFVCQFCAQVALLNHIVLLKKGRENGIGATKVGLTTTTSYKVLHSKTHEYSLEEREAAYLAARERIFSTDEGEMRESVRQKPRTDPVVARRMIVHALGQRVRMLNLDSPSQNIRSAKGLSTHHNLKEEKVCTSTGEAQQKIDCSLGESINMFQKVKARDDTATGSTQDSMPKESQNSKLSNLNEKHVPISTEHMKVENLGAAKRLFANALGLQTTKEGLHPKKETLHNSCKRL